MQGFDAIELTHVAPRPIIPPTLQPTIQYSDI